MFQRSEFEIPEDPLKKSRLKNWIFSFSNLQALDLKNHVIVSCLAEWGKERRLKKRVFTVDLFEVL